MRCILREVGEYSAYVEVYSRATTDAFALELSILTFSVSNFEDSLQGKYSKKQAYAKKLTANCDLPGFLVIDLGASFDNLDVIFVDGHVFSPSL